MRGDAQVTATKYSIPVEGEKGDKYSMARVRDRGHPPSR